MNYNLIKIQANLKGITINALSEMVGYTPQGFHKCLRDCKLMVHTLEKLAEILNVPITYFFTGEIENDVTEQNKLLKENIKLLRDKLAWYDEIYNTNQAAEIKVNYSKVKSKKVKPNS